MKANLKVPVATKGHQPKTGNSHRPFRSKRGSAKVPKKNSAKKSSSSKSASKKTGSHKAGLKKSAPKSKVGKE